MSTSKTITALVDTVFSKYDIGTLVKIEALPTDAIRAALLADQAPHTDGFKITTSKGCFCLKTHKEMRAEAWAELQSKILLFAERENFALTPRLVLTADGDHCFTLAGEDFWLSRFIESDRSYTWFDPQWGVRECKLAGQGLAALHEFFRRYSFACNSDLLLNRESKLVPARFSQELAPLTVGLFDQIKELLSLVDEGLGASLGLETGWREGYLASLESALSRIHDLFLEPVLQKERCDQLVHGDYHPGNLLFLADRLAGVVDYEYLHFDDVFLDLGYAASMFCLKWDQEGDDGSIDKELLTALLQGYGVDRSHKRAMILLNCYMTVSLCLQFKWLVETRLRLINERRSILLPAIRHVLAAAKRLSCSDCNIL